MYNSFELFFFWHKSGTVVVVGVPDVFFASWVDWLIDFFEEREKAMCQLCVDCKKCDRKKQQKGGLRWGRQKECASPALRHAQRADEKGWGFLPAGGRPAELPVIYFQVKPDLWLLNLCIGKLTKVRQRVQGWNFTSVTEHYMYLNKAFIIYTTAKTGLIS